MANKKTSKKSDEFEFIDSSDYKLIPSKNGNRVNLLFTDSNQMVSIPTLYVKKILLTCDYKANQKMKKAS